MTTTATAEISVQNTNHPDTVVYHTKFEMVSETVAASRGDASELSGIPEMVLSIRGVMKVAVYPYLLSVTRAPMFDWKDIRPSVEEILRMFAASQKQLKEAVGGSGEVASSEAG